MSRMSYLVQDSGESIKDIVTRGRDVGAHARLTLNEPDIAPHMAKDPDGPEEPFAGKEPQGVGEAYKDIMTKDKKHPIRLRGSVTKASAFRGLSQIVDRGYARQKGPDSNPSEDVGEAYKDIETSGKMETPTKTTTSHRSRGRSMAILGKASQDMSIPAVRPPAPKQTKLPKVNHPLKPYDSARVIQHERLKNYSPEDRDNQGELAGKSAQTIPDPGDAARRLLVRQAPPGPPVQPKMPKVLWPAQKTDKVKGLESGQKKTDKEAAYMHGFLDKCAALNVDLDHLFKYGYEQWAAMPPPSLTRSNYYSDTGRSATVGSSKTPRTAESTPSQRASSRPAQNRSYQQSHSTGQQQNAGGGGSSSTTNNAPRSSAGTSRTQRVGQEHTYRAPATRTETRTKSPDPQPRRRRSWLSALRYDSPDAPWLAPSPMSTYNQAPDHQDAGYEPMDLGGLLGALVGATGGSEGYSEAPAPMYGGGGGDAGGGDGGSGGE